MARRRGRSEEEGTSEAPPDPTARRGRAPPRPPSILFGRSRSVRFAARISARSEERPASRQTALLRHSQHSQHSPSRRPAPRDGPDGPHGGVPDYRDRVFHALFHVLIVQETELGHPRGRDGLPDTKQRVGKKSWW